MEEVDTSDQVQGDAAVPAAEEAIPAAGVTEAASDPGRPRRARGRRTALRFAVAFAFGVLAVLAVSAGALAAYESSNTGRIVPGVHVGSLDLSGLPPAEAAARLRSAYDAMGTGTLTLRAGDTTREVPYSDVGRRVDVDTLVAEAMSIGRGGPAIERLASNVRILLSGTDLAPRATFEPAALRFEINALAKAIAQPATNATVAAAATGFVVTPGIDGRAAEVEAAFAAAQSLLSDPAAPQAISVVMPVAAITPDVTTTAANAAKEAADRIAVDMTLVQGTDSWTIAAADIHGWISFSSAPDGTYRPVVAKDGLEAGLAKVAADVAVAPVDATFLVSKSNSIVGVTQAKDGRALDTASTEASLVALIDQRVAGLSASQVTASITTVQPALTTADAEKTAPLMKPISSWTTYFPVGSSNGNGVNIWIPAANIDGQVVLPGQWFDFWKAIGPVTRAAGYKDGGVIIDGHSEPQGALAGGICSCSTTLFNAALRAGLQMGDRANHYYYINRYPLGLDATVFQSSSGSIQTMTFRNDTAKPILIRSYRWRVGSRGYVKFEIWSAPTDRTVALSKPIVKNIRPAGDSIVYTTSLAPGVKHRVESPVDGKDVWVTRTVKDAQGKIVHQDTYYSHYSRVTGVLEVGAPAPPPPPPPSPAP